MRAIFLLQQIRPLHQKRRRARYRETLALLRETDR